MIMDRLLDHGHEVYVVGGAVRDFLLGRTVHDVDFATSARPSEVLSLFKRTVPVGIEHGTVMVIVAGESFEVTTFRSESGYDDFRHPNAVTFEASLDRDLLRRDFTINALAMDRNGRVIDRFGGRDDLAARTIRMVGDAASRIKEDPLRIMRGFRFVSELGFTLGEAEAQAFRRHAPLLSRISVERIDQEMTRLLAGPAASRALCLLAESGCFDVLPYLAAADRCLTPESIDFTVLRSDEERWTAFLDAAKIEDVHRFARAWSWSRVRERSVSDLRRAVRLKPESGWDRRSVYLVGIGPALGAERIAAAFGKIRKDALVTQLSAINALWRACPIHARNELAVNGTDLLNWSGKRPGRWLSDALQQIEWQVVLGALPNKREAIESWFRIWQKQNK